MQESSAQVTHAANHAGKPTQTSASSNTDRAHLKTDTTQLKMKVISVQRALDECVGEWKNESWLTAKAKKKKFDEDVSATWISPAKN
jgi:hypothetical protein